MKIKRILYQYRRDFKAEYMCDHCGHTITDRGYDDANFHHHVIPNMICVACGKKTGEDYRPLETKYPEGFQI